MESDIDVSKSPKEIFFEGIREFALLRNIQVNIHNIERMWELAGKPAVNAVKFTTQDLKDGLDASLIPVSDDLKEAMLVEWINELQIALYELRARKLTEEEE